MSEISKINQKYEYTNYYKVLMEELDKYSAI